MKSIKVSFIIPIYNVEQFLPACLDSILNQSIQDIEIICINDCSPDNSQKILNAYAAKDPRFKVIKFTENKGSGAARNAGLAIASGAFIRMIDGDDFIPLDSTEKLLQAATKHDSNFVKGGFWSCLEHGKISAKGWSYPNELTINTTIRTDHRLWGIDQHWAYLYRTKALLATGIQYDESMRNGQDAAFIVGLMPYLEKVTLIPETVYIYRTNPASTTRRKKSKTFFLNVLSLYDRAYNSLNTIDLKEGADSVFYFSLCNYLSKKIFPAIPTELQYEDAKDILIYLKELFKKHEAKRLCFTNHYSWQRQAKIPAEIKYLILLLQEDYFFEAYNTLNSIRIQSVKKRKLKKQIKGYQNKLNSIQNSTSWRITAPMRKFIDNAKNSLSIK